MGSLVYTYRRFSKSVPLKRLASSKNIFIWFCGVLICQRGLIPHRTKSCGVSDPAEQDPGGYQTRRTKSCGVSDPAEQWQICVHFIAYTCSARSDTYTTEQCPAGSDTPQNNEGIRPRGTTFKNEYFCKFEKEFENILGFEFGDYMGSIRGKTQRSKISCYCPFKCCFSNYLCGYISHTLPPPQAEENCVTRLFSRPGLQVISKDISRIFMTKRF